MKAWPTALTLLTFSLSASAALASQPAHAEIPAIRKQVVEGNGHRMHIVTVNLTHPDVKGIVTTPPAKRGAVTSDFARASGSVAAVNGDFYDGRFVPLGLTVHNGKAWPGVVDTAEWSFLACTADNECTIDTSGKARAVDPAWKTVVGGKDVLLKGDWVWSVADDNRCGELCTLPHPRTAVGLTADGKTMFLLVVEGRQPGILGLPLSALARYLKDLGADTALNFDGGFSTELVWDGRVVSGRPTRMPQERPVANHLGVVVVRSKTTSER